MRKEKIILDVLRICAILIFGGRAYHYLFFKPPFRNILWDQELLSPIVEGWFKMPWTEYVSSPTVDNWIQGTIQVNGILFLFAAIACACITNQNKKWLQVPIYLASLSLVLLAFLAMRETFHHYGQFFEHSIQIAVPVILVWAVGKKINTVKRLFILKILIAITFISHGLYALGYYPIPGHFINMTITSLGVTEPIAKQILWTAGVLDMILSIVIFIPKYAKYALYYAAFWGLATALARIVGPFNFDFIATSIHQTWYQTLYRLPHGLIPLLVAMVHTKNTIQQQNETTNNPKLNLLA